MLESNVCNSVLSQQQHSTASSSGQLDSPSLSASDHADRDQAGAHSQDRGAGRVSLIQHDGDATEGTSVGVEDVSQGVGSVCPSDQAAGLEQGLKEEGNSSGTGRRHERVLHSKQHHSPDLCEGRGEGFDGAPRQSLGQSEFRKACVGASEGRTGTTEVGECPADPTGGAQQVPQGDVRELIEPDSDSEWQSCPEQQCFQTHKKIGQSWLENRNPYGQVWNELIRQGRIFLLEVACGPQSVLSEEVMKQLGPDTAVRCSIWNGYDLTTTTGVNKLKKLIRETRPVHIWVSCDCGPYSPLQRLNQKTPEQKQMLESKREYARREYSGGIEVATYGRRHGSQVHWELSECCEAWNLSCVQAFLSQLGLQKVTCNGCCVGLRAHDTGDLMCKGWSIATTNSSLLRHLHLPCQRNHKKVVCESGRPAQSAYYTPVFAKKKKVVEALREHETWSVLACELSETTCSEDPLFCVEPCETALVNDGEISVEEKQRIMRLIRHIHCTTGHGSIATLVNSLKHRGVPERILNLAREFKCVICEERKRTTPHRQATLETVAKKWQRIQCDLGSWTHPQTKHKVKFILFIDEGCRFRVGRILFENSRNQATWPIVRKVFEEAWLASFGQPEEIRADPEGIWRSDEAAAYCQERGIILSPIPAEAHWQIGVVEEAIGALKHVMTSLAQDFSEMEVSELFYRSIWACNSRDNQHGYSPAQHAMGRTPDEWGRLFDSEVEGHPIHPQQMVGGGFKTRLARAEAAGTRPLKSFTPGDLVFYWRKQVQGGGDKGFSWRGQFLGPARVLAVETRVDDEGKLRPGSCVWLHRAGRLIKAAPEQLRAASSREKAVEELKGPCEIPWTITSLASHPQRSTYWDISSEVPNNQQWQEASEHPTGRRRCVGKRTMETTDARAARPRLDEQDAEMPAASEAAQVGEEQTFTVFEVTVDIPSSNRGFKKFCQNPEAFVVNQIKRSHIEVRERSMTDSELAEFKEAKGKEVRNYIQSHCFKVLPPELQNANDAVGMRWVLTWKLGDDPDRPRKAKARAVILGYQDKDYEYKQTSSPTLSRSGRQLFLAFCSRHHFRVRKGDVSSAFLQGDELENGMLVQPTREICEALQIPEGSVTQLQRAAYGLVEAPLWWYKSVSSYLLSIGYTRMKTEPCIWVYFDKQQKPRSAISGHVDDFLFAGCDGDQVHQELMSLIQAMFKWGTWEDSPFLQCGVKVVQDDRFGFTLSQQDFIEGLSPIKLSRDRVRQREQPTTDHEKSQMRAVLGSLSWVCGQTNVLHSVDVNYLVSTIPLSTIQDVVKLNNLVEEVKRTAPQLKIHSLQKGEPVDLVAWGDAAWANRPDNIASTEGIVLGMAPKALRQGSLTNVSLLSWKSGKIERKCRSPACAEVHAVVNAEDELYHMRYLWSEMHFPRSVLNTLAAAKIVALSPGIVVTDSKNLYDRLDKDTPTIKGEEKRATIEALALKDSSEESGTELRWVHSDAQLGNSLTKPTEKGQLQLFFKLGQRWRIVYDENMRSAGRRKAVGIKPMDN